MGNNTYKIELPEDYRVSPIFNIADLFPFVPEEPLDSRTSQVQPGESDARGPLPNEDSSLEAKVQLIMKDWATQMKPMGPDGLWGLNGPQMIFN